MGRQRIDMTGQVYERLTVVGFAGKTDQGRHSLWNCLCECGTSRRVSRRDLIEGTAQSCGCLLRELRAQRKFERQRAKEVGKPRRNKHGHHVNYKPSPEWSTWAAMKARCNNPNNPGYKNYGGASVTVCPQWLHDFRNFLTDTGLRPEGCSLDRINPFGRYSPENVRWVGSKTQAKNKRKLYAKIQRVAVQLFTHLGTLQTLLEAD